MQAIVSHDANRFRWRCRGQWWDVNRLAASVSRATTAAVICDPANRDDVWGLLEVLDADFENGCAHLSLVMRPDRTRGPWAGDATHAFCATVFEQWPHLHKLNLEVLAGNDALLPGLRRLLHHEGTLAGQVLLGRERVDVELYAIFQGDVERLAPVLAEAATDRPGASVETVLIDLGFSPDVWSRTPAAELDSLSLLEILNLLDADAGHQVDVGAIAFEGASLTDVVLLAEQYRSRQV